MKITPKNQETRKFQVGGAMPAGAPAEDPTVGGGAPTGEPAPDQLQIKEENKILL